uniref:4-hydroxy-tetrahydrodipicolinate synthase n=1 Tax=Globisporangium ultimum (strain ATCC 200006 / CBS 805.95 / DAOM BR144) TaxID=431595 RepID=K3X721_GLOUD
MKVEGVYTALVTPFTRDAKRVDYAKLRELVEWQIQAGINGLVVLGSTGENQCVSIQEREQIISTVVEITRRRVPVVAGTSANSTAETITHTLAAKTAGVDACMVMSPFYSVPSQKGLYEHFRSVAQVGLPVMLYNNPGRAGVTILPETVARLSAVPGIVAVKEATGNVAQATEIAALCDITIFGGEDTLALPLMAIGATGVMSVLSNAAPARVLAMTNAFINGDYATARKLHIDNYLLSKSLFVEASPAPIKQTMELLGLCSASVRLPLTPCSEETTALLKRQLQVSKLLSSCA